MEERIYEGKRYGHLTTKCFEKYRYTSSGRKLCYWRFTCDCENEVVLRSDIINNKKDKSCLQDECPYKINRDSYTKGFSVPVNLTNQRFGRLVAIERCEDWVYPNGGTRIQWLCQCDCGNTKKIRANALTTGQTKSCGCLIKENKSGGKPRKNDYSIKNNIVVCGLGDGIFFTFSVEDYELVKKYSWGISSDGYPITQDYLKLHRLLLGDKSESIDHIDKNKLNNCRDNLRECTVQENNWNNPLKRNNTSGIIGVCYSTNHKVWRAYITKNKKRYSLGSYKIKEDAIKARFQAELKYFGEYAPQKNLFNDYRIEV